MVAMEKTKLESMLTIRQVAAFLHVSISTVRRWSDKGMLKCYHIGSRGDRRYRRRDVLQFLEKSTYHLRTGPLEGRKPARCGNKQAFHLN